MAENDGVKLNISLTFYRVDSTLTVFDVWLNDEKCC